MQNSPSMCPHKDRVHWIWMRHKSGTLWKKGKRHVFLRLQLSENMKKAAFFQFSCHNNSKDLFFFCQARASFKVFVTWHLPKAQEGMPWLIILSSQSSLQNQRKKSTKKNYDLDKYSEPIFCCHGSWGRVPWRPLKWARSKIGENKWTMKLLQSRTVP